MELISLILMIVVFLLIDRMASQPLMLPVRVLDQDSQDRLLRLRAEHGHQE